MTINTNTSAPNVNITLNTNKSTPKYDNKYEYKYTKNKYEYKYTKR